MTDLIPYEKKQPVVMKSGLVHWVSEETGIRIQQQLNTQSAHTFMRISELQITINTAEVEGVYTMEQYGDIEKVKQGMWQCQYKGWHNKGKRECECQKEFFKRQREKRKEQEEAETNRPLTAEEQEEGRRRFRIMNEEAAISGSTDSIFHKMYVKHNKGDRSVRRSTINAWEARTGRQANLEHLVIDEDVDRETRAEALEVLA